MRLPLVSSLLSFILVSGIGFADAATLKKRAPAQVFSKCTVPNTVALTFVSRTVLKTNESLLILARGVGRWALHMAVG